MKKEIKYSVIFIVIVLILSWSLTMFFFSKPETVQLFPLVMFIPAIVGIIINSIRYKSFKLVFKPITTRINLKSILFSLIYPLLFIGLVAIVLSLTGIGKFNSDKLSELSNFPSIEMIIIGFLLMFGEEYGWRGFLLKELATAKGKIYSAIVVGIVWALWHGPVVFGLANQTNMENPLLISVIQMGAVFVFSLPFAYSYFLTNNILPPMIFHFVWNFYNPMILGNIYQNQPGIIEGNMIYINGEGLAGIIFGSIFIIWYINTFKKSSIKSITS
ncbi:CAAX prenyl protease-like protein [Ancylomarina subtilis]|uniref:CAAX prenyl protease-like protein n=1 Tax=Ancylomarina subtilis TaxID=1639035 RepID=A0A4Q7VI00_9BACT|nr:type II CAAX endopeptidase family protein [Ancylomarina subtilis]RZT95741.1 CAAX prenyl protease-like protein [Ancylomarina subtilis]